MSTIKERYNTDIVPKLKEAFQYTNIFEIPKLEKIVLNMGLGEAVRNPKIIESAVAELALIAGQKPVITRAKKPIANFKLRTGLPIGCKVTLRREKMFDFFEKLVNIALPRVRDFKGISGKAFDGRGNYSLGITEHIIFPEIDYDKTESIKGLNVTVVTTAKTDEEGKALLKFLGMPFKN
ncbi:MAG: 50S ribosomal protein L5 [Desulfobacterales bacterium RIFOXYA12_FULL_46_15]|nr:MAG: 50S ribosomal protein L5 [Desulfobacula sp. GWF2_41_7]OGR24620.1 MAG: 50S ribosomal protein L5 [Desulfobacterales bacterium RIFOXYA12_FULL_46_15]